MLLCKDLSWISEASSHITLQGRCGLGVLAGIDVLGHSLSQCGNFRAQKRSKKQKQKTKTNNKDNQTKTETKKKKKKKEHQRKRE